MRLPIESVRKTAGYLTLVPAYGRDYKSKREVMEAWDAGKDFIVQDMMSPYDGKPLNKSDAKAGGVGNVNIRYKGMRSVAVIKVAKFPEGKKMTVDEVAEVVGPEFKEMNEDPPESVKKVREDMEESMSSDLLPVERAAASRTAGSYLDLFFDEKDIPYKVFDVKDSQGVTHSIPNEVVIEAIKGTRGGEQAKIEKMLRMIDFKNGDVNHYLEHLARGLAEQYSGNLRFASPQQAEKLEAEAEANEAQADADRQKADAARMKEGAGGLYGYTKDTQSDVESTIRKAQRQASKLAKTLHGQDSQAMDFLRVHAKRANSKTARLLLALMGEYPKVDLLPIEQVKQAENTPMGMYGYPSGTARLALDACSALRSGIGEVAYNLHSRRMAKHDRITGFLKDHSKAVKCGYTRLLLDTYPESPRLAAKKKIPDALKKHQFTKDDNPNPKGNDKDGDGKSGEKPDFLKEIEDKKGKKASLRRAARRHFAGRRYDYDEVIDFLTDDNSTPELERMWKKWSEMVEDLHDRWFEGWAEANAPELLDESIDYKELAWKAFGSITGMGIGLWEGDFLGDEHDEAFEKVVERDSKVSRFGQDLNDAITMVQEGEDEESMRMASDQMIRKAFVPDSVDGWLEWADGTRTAAHKTAMRQSEVEDELMKMLIGDTRVIRGPKGKAYANWSQYFDVDPKQIEQALASLVQQGRLEKTRRGWERVEPEGSGYRRRA